MGVLLLLLPGAAALLTIYLIHAHLTYKSKERLAGCSPAPLFRPWDLLGIANFRIELNGMKINALSQAFIDRKREMSLKLGRDCKTFRIYYPPGETWYYTFEPRNLQAVLATQFGDFQQPQFRVAAFERLMGMGIVCCPQP